MVFPLTPPFLPKTEQNQGVVISLGLTERFASCFFAVLQPLIGFAFSKQPQVDIVSSAVIAFFCDWCKIYLKRGANQKISGRCLLLSYALNIERTEIL